MSKSIKTIALPLLLVLIVSLFSFYGCTGAGITQGGAATTTAQGATAGESLSQEQLEKILSDSVVNYENLTTYRFDIDMDITADVSGGDQSGSMSIFTGMSGAANVITNEMQATMEMFMDYEGMGEESGSQNLDYDMYLLTDWLYMRISMLGTGEQWMKIPMSPALAEEFNLNTVDEQMEPLDSPVKIEYLRSEEVDGLDCYVLSITPDMDELAKWLNEQAAVSGGVDWQGLVDYSEIFKKMSYICYVTKESNLMKRMVIDMVMDYNAEQVGDYSGEFDTMLMNIKMDMTLYDQNKPFTIILPDEAAGAIEVSEDMFLD